MEHVEKINLLKNIVSGLGKLLGTDTEIVLHDLTLGQVVQIENSEVTGRSVGYRTNPSLLSTILQLSDEDGHLIGYKSNSPSGKPLRSSHLVFRSEAGQPDAMICINQDISKLSALRDTLDQLVNTRYLGQQPQEEIESDYITKVTRKVILQTIERIKPTAINTKEGKLQMLAALDKQGIFSVKDAVPQVCNTLGISQATLYNYLRELRTEPNSTISSDQAMML